MASKWIGGGTGNELSEHTRECYGFLCNNWREGDEIFLFGFSRGSCSPRHNRIFFRTTYTMSMIRLDLRTDDKLGL